MSVAAVVLAAGSSTRMGRPKALLPWRGRTFVEHAVGLALGAACQPIVAVQGAVALPSLAVDVVINDAWEQGPLTSLQAGLLAVSGAAPTGVLVLTVDRPHVGQATVDALVRAHLREPAAVLQPAYEGRRGHPILHPADVAAMLAALRPPATARDVVRSPAVAKRRTFVAVDDPAILENIDTPDDLRCLP